VVRRIARRLLRRPPPPPAAPSVEGMVNEFQDTLGALQASHRELARLYHRAERTVGDLESFNRHVLASISSGVICFTADGAVSLANPSARRILRLAASLPLLGKTAAELWGSSSPVTALVEETLRSPRNRSRIELRLPGEDGADAWVGVSVSVLETRGSAVGGVILLMTDLTEVRALRAELSLRQRLGAMGELTACIAHNFRNSLAAILGYATLLSRRVGPEADLRRPVDAILREVQQMETEIRALLDGLRLDPSLEHRSDLAEVVRSALDGLRPEMDAAGVTLELKLARGAPPVRGDAGALGQMVANLARNAVQAMPEGGLLRISVASHASGLELLVEDSGVGIPPENLARVFQPFFSTRKGGSGLGLALVKSTADRLGGRVELESEPGRGTRARVLLPAAEVVHAR
jgi:signal transduction histidine kinase